MAIWKASRSRASRLYAMLSPFGRSPGRSAPRTRPGPERRAGRPGLRARRRRSCAACARASSIATEARSRRSASACSASSTSGCDDQFAQPLRRRHPSSAGRTAPAASATPSRRSVPGVLPDSVESEAMSRMSSLSWNATPICSPNARSVSTVDGRRRRSGAELGGGGDQRAGLVGEHAEVVLDRVVALGRGPTVSRICPTDQPLERARLQPHGVRAEVGQQIGRAGEQEVAGEDRDGVVPARVRRLGAAAHARLVHDVVVVERREVGELDDDRGRHDLRRGRVAEMRGQHAHQRAEPLAAGVDEVAGRLGDELVVGRHRGAQRRPRPRPARPAPTSSRRGVGERRRRASVCAHPRSVRPWCARSRIGCGKTPSTIVTSVAEGERDRGRPAAGWRSSGAFSGGSAKNISTTMRR